MYKGEKELLRKTTEEEQQEEAAKQWMLLQWQFYTFLDKT